MSKITAFKGGEVQFNGLLLYNYKNEYVDLISNFVEVSIYEDILSPTLSGSITIVDSSDLSVFFPIVGEEKLKILFNTPGLSGEDSFDHDFYVYKCSSKVQTNTNTKVYVLDFISFEAISDANLKISKRFSGTAEQSIKTILRSNAFLDTKKRYEFDTAANRLEFVAPYWSPFQCIKYLASNSVLKENPNCADFLFYETRIGYHLRSIESLILDEKRPLNQYVYHDRDDRASDGKSKSTAKQFTKILDYTCDESSDYLKNIETGLFSNTLFIHDIVGKKFKTKFLDYAKSFDELTNLNDNKLFSENLIRKKTSKFSYYTQDNYPQGIFNREYADKRVLYRNSRLHQMGSNKMEIQIFGRTDLIVGDKIKIGIPNNTSNSKAKADDQFDPLLSGNYMITAIHHRVTLDKHIMDLEVVKDSYREEVF